MYSTLIESKKRKSNLIYHAIGILSGITVFIIMFFVFNYEQKSSYSVNNNPQIAASLDDLVGITRISAAHAAARNAKSWVGFRVSDVCNGIRGGSIKEISDYQIVTLQEPIGGLREVNTLARGRKGNKLTDLKILKACMVPSDSGEITDDANIDNIINFNIPYANFIDAYLLTNSRDDAENLKQAGLSPKVLAISGAR